MKQTKAKVGGALDETLSDVLTLDLAVRQGRRNCSGKGFSTAQRFLDGLADAAREAGHGLAARSVHLHHMPSLWEETTARQHALRLVGSETFSEAETLSAFTQILASITRRLTANIRATDCDLVTQALLIRLSVRLDTIAETIHSRRAA